MGSPCRISGGTGLALPAFRADVGQSRGDPSGEYVTDATEPLSVGRECTGRASPEVPGLRNSGGESGKRIREAPPLRPDSYAAPGSPKL